MRKTLRLGTRGSPLALIQAETVRQKLLAAHPELEAGGVEIIPMQTTGDWRPGGRESRLADLGGDKGLFTKEIEEALQNETIDLATHSMKDLAGRLPAGLEIAAVLPRADPRDAFIGRSARRLEDLPKGASVGTSSLRRQAQLLALRPDLHVVPLRGNVDTRLRKISDGLADATLLAVAGLDRLGARDRISSILEPDVMLPAVAQGAIGVEIRERDDDMRRMLAPINDHATWLCVGAERALLYVLDGSCHTPIGALARLTKEDELTLDGLVARPDGSGLLRMQGKGLPSDYHKIGAELGRKLKAQMPPGSTAA
ncbi:MAG: hydroxymethylbilane synthase [Pseudomonadota bacterium]|nr:hydroxymethylbilane synthase [Pseudomonadota bacterium]